MFQRSPKLENWFELPLKDSELHRDAAWVQAHADSRATQMHVCGGQELAVNELQCHALAHAVSGNGEWKKPAAGAEKVEI